MPKNYNRLGAWKNDAIPKKLRRRPSEELPEWNEDVLPQWRDRMEAEEIYGPSKEILNREAPVTGNLPDEDIDEVPFSLFLDEQKEKDILWEYFVDNLRFSPKLVVRYIGGANTYASVFALTDWGFFDVGWYDDDESRWEFWSCIGSMYEGTRISVTYNRFSVAGTSASDLTNLVKFSVFQLHPEVFATEAAMDAYVVAQFPLYYSSDPRYGNIGNHQLSAPVETLPEELFYQHYSMIKTAALNRGMFKSGKYAHSMATLINVSDLIDALAADAAADAAAAEEMSRSERSWPELPGLATRYIDNVGVFLPDNLDVDFNLSHTLGSQLVACRVMRPSSSKLEAVAFDNNSWNMAIDFFEAGAGNIQEGEQPKFGEPMGANAGGPAQGMINIANLFRSLAGRAYDAVRVVYPRLRAFGRQMTPIPSYSQYSSGIGKFFWNFGTMNMKGMTLLVDMNAYHTYKKIIVKLTDVQYAAFVEPLREFI